MSFSDLDILAEKVEMPPQVLHKIEFNDELRKNLLLTNCLTLQKQGLKWVDFHEEEPLNMERVCPVYLYSSDKMSLNRQIDNRVEDMILNPDFLPEIIDFAKTLKDDTQSPFLVSIGFLDTLRYLKYTL